MDTYEVLGFIAAFLGVVAAMTLLNARLSEHARKIRRAAYGMAGLFQSLLLLLCRAHVWDGGFILAAFVVATPLVIFLVDKEGEYIGKIGAWIRDGFAVAALLGSAGYAVYMSMPV